MVRLMPAAANHNGRTREARYHLAVYLSPAELAALDRYLKASGLTRSEHMRRHGLNPASGRRETQPVLPRRRP